MPTLYSLSAELPATRKSLQQAQTCAGQQDGPSLSHEQQPPTPSTPGLAADQETSVRTGPTSTSADRQQATVQNDLSLRRGATRSGTGKDEGETAAFKFHLNTSETTYDERGYLVLKPADIFGLTPNAFTEDKSNDEGRPRSRRLAYLEGLRGVLGLQVLLWTFFRIFAPAIVADRDIDGVYPATFVARAPGWQSVLRKVLSPLLFDGELQASFFIILSGRTSLQTFIERRDAVSLAGAAFKRPFRFILPMAVTLALVSLVIAVNGFRYATALSGALDNQLAQPPAQWNSALEYFNALMFFFSTPSYFKTARAASFIPPSGILWIVPVLFQQTYVLIVLAFILPYTVLWYKSTGMFLLILATAWVGRFSWYTLTGLLLSEWSTIYLQLLPTPHQRIPLHRAGSRSMPACLPGLLFVLLGAMFKYLWIAALPADANKELVAHVDGNTGKLNYGTNPTQVAYPRYDNWLLATGVLYLIEVSPRCQRLLSIRPLVHLGRWAFSIALISGTLMLSLGSFVWHHLTSSLGWTSEAAILGVLFVTLIPASCVLVEAYSRLCDDGALWFSRWLFRWIRV